MAETADEDSNGTIDNEELRNCLNKLQVQMSEEEIDNIHRYCDIDNRKGIQFPEFVVFLCLMYLLFGSDVTYRVSIFLIILLLQVNSTHRVIICCVLLKPDHRFFVSEMFGVRFQSLNPPGSTMFSMSSSTPSCSSTRMEMAR